MSLEALKSAPLSSKQSACVFLLGTFEIFLRSSCSSNHCPTARCVLAANLVGKFVDILLIYT
jgi:hypothetical protein